MKEVYCTRRKEMLLASCSSSQIKAGRAPIVSEVKDGRMCYKGIKVLCLIKSDPIGFCLDGLGSAEILGQSTCKIRPSLAFHDHSSCSCPSVPWEFCRTNKFLNSNKRIQKRNPKLRCDLLCIEHTIARVPQLMDTPRGTTGGALRDLHQINLYYLKSL